MGFPGFSLGLKGFRGPRLSVSNVLGVLALVLQVLQVSSPNFVNAGRVGKSVVLKFCMHGRLGATRGVRDY